MIRRSLSFAALALGLALGGPPLLAYHPGHGLASDKQAQQDALKAAIKSDARTPANVLRDRYRHPYETLSFFGVKPSDTVVEIWPGGGWYTEILAPYLGSGRGRYIAVDMGAERLAAVRKLAQANPKHYWMIGTADFPVFPEGGTGVPDGSADVVLTFRNVHNWRMGYRRADKQDYSEEAFRQIVNSLR